METTTSVTSNGTTSKTKEELELQTAKDDAKKNAGFIILLIMMAIGVFGILVISIFACFGKAKCGSPFWNVFGLSLLIGLAASICGGFLGFLFGIPRSLQKKGDDRSYANNTNLEEISDWLTKIIVGVSLTQLPAIEKRFHLLSLKVSAGFSDYLGSNLPYSYAAALMTFFAVCGFFAVYLWSRIYLYEILTRLDKSMQDLLSTTVNAAVNTAVKDKLNNAVNTAVSAKVEDKFAEQQKAMELKLWTDRKKEFEMQRDRINNAETTASDEIKAILEIAKPLPVTIKDDCQQGRWGGQLKSGDYEVIANISQKANETEYFVIALTVQPVAGSGATLTENVYFFMHDSYYPNIITTIAAQNNMAEYYFTSFEAFTIGIVLNGGNVKLEVNLNTYPDCPEGYKYKDALYTYDQIKEEIKKLEQTNLNQ